MPFAQFSLPITFTEPQGMTVVDLDPGPDPWGITIPAGTYYNDGSGTADDLLKVIVDLLNAADPRGTWSVEDGREKTIQNENTIGTCAAVRFTRVMTSGSIVAFGPGAIHQTLGFSKDSVVSSDLEWISFDGVTFITEGLFMRRYHWRPYTITTNETPGGIAASSRSTTRGGKVSMQGYGQYRTLLWESEGLLAPMTASVWANDPNYSAEAGTQLGDPNIALEQFWRWCRVLCTDGRPPVVRYCPDLRYKDIFETVQVVAEGWINNLENVYNVLVDGPKRTGVNIPMRFTSEATTPVSGAYDDTIVIVTQGIPEFEDLYTALRAVAPLDWFLIKYGAKRHYAQKIDEYQCFPHPPADFPMRKWGQIGQMFLPISAQQTLDPFSFVGDGIRIKYNFANAATSTSGVGGTDERWVDNRPGGRDIGLYMEYRLPRPSALELFDVAHTSGFAYVGWVRAPLFINGFTHLAGVWVYSVNNSGGSVAFANFFSQVMSGNRHRRFQFTQANFPTAPINIAYAYEQVSAGSPAASFGTRFGVNVTGWQTESDWRPCFVWHSSTAIVEDATWDVLSIGGITQGVAV